ncbi:NAD(P)H-hydrate dehydratase [Enterococcus sp. BWT-B8]|uniref:NAD(P)H-hydrate dehydratase n=1 Tax=Enterococcus sp. BWT-B8 TaxID=2885157 RepID=UPI001E4C34E6|nr:NAD(P)H-hydrate dehydratase [Enterococcus sp. BWT-B8]MCB5952754.1 NAD(P)H-hydrate dehydratase [Enterococcus sp. BWT-B8]
MKTLSVNNLKKVITKRPENSHKGTFGRAVLIGGNEQYGGAIIMSAQAAIYAGTGLVTVITDRKNHAPLHARLPEAMAVDWLDTELIDRVLKSADVILIGPGLGLGLISQHLLIHVLESQTDKQWLIIDGSAITLFAEKDYPLNNPEQTIFTPHQREWEALSGLPLKQQTDKANQTAREMLKASVVLKSHCTKIYTSKTIYKTPIGTAAMATGGMGDTLAGIITGFIAQFPAKEEALCAAVYLHSLIGEDLSKTQYVVLPTSISEQLPIYMKQFEEK